MYKYRLGSTGASQIHEMHGLVLPVYIYICVYVYVCMLHFCDVRSRCLDIFLCLRLCCRVLIRAAIILIVDDVNWRSLLFLCLVSYGHVNFL